ncbi:MAG: Ysc84 actin-binding domain protein [Planctomycetota bacterium]|nr:MAG: Ysc84 actin-binding domain protein [Planctomycetota bacterium]
MHGGTRMHIRSLVRRFLVATGFVLLLVVCPQTFGQTREAQTLRDAIQVLDEVMAIPLSGIPRSLLADAKGVAIVPGVIKGSFVVGARFGRGVLVVRDENGNWSVPRFITLTGGNVGWQIGVTSTDVILVFRTKKSVENLLDGTLTLGGDAAVAAGPVGRKASAGTDIALRSEVFSYCRSRGLFAGVAIDGSVIRIDNAANMAYYGTPDPAQVTSLPEDTQKLLASLAKYCGAGNEKAPDVPSALHGNQADVAAETLRRELAASAMAMYRLLPPEWQTYLALPADVFSQSAHPTAVELEACMERYRRVAEDARYRALTGRLEFQDTYAALQQYHRVLERNAQPLQLPPPPDQPNSDNRNVVPINRLPSATPTETSSRAIFGSPLR